MTEPLEVIYKTFHSDELPEAIPCDVCPVLIDPNRRVFCVRTTTGRIMHRRCFS